MRRNRGPETRDTRRHRSAPRPIRRNPTKAGPAHLPVLPVFLALALGPHPQRELTLTRSRGFPGPRLRVAAGALALALGPHPQRELTLTRSRGFPGPRLRVAAGAPRLLHPLSRSTSFPTTATDRHKRRRCRPQIHDGR